MNHEKSSLKVGVTEHLAQEYKNMIKHSLEKNEDIPEPEDCLTKISFRVHVTRIVRKVSDDEWFEAMSGSTLYEQDFDNLEVTKLINFLNK